MLHCAVGDDLILLIDAKDSYVQWPQNHIHSPSKMEIVMKKKKKNHQRSAPPLVPTILGVEVSSEFKQKLRTPLMNSLLLEARVLKASGSLINVSIDDHVLHLDDYTSPISYEELIHWCDEGEIGASHIAIFMRYLSDLSDTMKSTSFYGFLFPETLSKFASVTDDLRSDYVARAMTCTQCGRGRKLIFAAYHESDHWMLAAINPSESIVYWCDPAGYTEPRTFIMEIINRWIITGHIKSCTSRIFYRRISSTMKKIRVGRPTVYSTDSSIGEDVEYLSSHLNSKTDCISSNHHHVQFTPEIEKTYVHRVYDAIAPHFSATRFAKWPKVAAFWITCLEDLLC
ncbi:uncharacterized protein LOC141618818 [Silene latifolia]|uniref:uncharacterized protein LOC141618818 n=1 Tax=Silene latifolia TaxID=37657 RepID=UPI003D77F56B